MGDHPNLYGDLSAGSGVNALRRDPGFAREFLLRRRDRLMFGTDKLTSEQTVEQRAVLDELDLPRGVLEKVAHGNAARVL